MRIAWVLGLAIVLAGLFGPAANVKFGMTAEELASAVPALADKKTAELPGFPGVTMSAYFNDDTKRVTAVMIAFPGHGAGARAVHSGRRPPGVREGNCEHPRGQVRKADADRERARVSSGSESERYGAYIASMSDAYF
jgi:hypothetical protein